MFTGRLLITWSMCLHCVLVFTNPQGIWARCRWCWAKAHGKRSICVGRVWNWCCRPSYQCARGRAVWRGGSWIRASRIGRKNAVLSLGWIHNAWARLVRLQLENSQPPQGWPHWKPNHWLFGNCGNGTRWCHQVVPFEWCISLHRTSNFLETWSTP